MAVTAPLVWLLRSRFSGETSEADRFVSLMLRRETPGRRGECHGPDALEPSPRSAAHPRWNEPACLPNSLAIPAAKRAAGGRSGPLAAVVCGPGAPAIVRYFGEAGADLLVLTAAHVAPAAETPWGMVRRGATASLEMKGGWKGRPRLTASLLL